MELTALLLISKIKLLQKARSIGIIKSKSKQEKYLKKVLFECSLFKWLLSQ